MRREVLLYVLSSRDCVRYVALTSSCQLFGASAVTKEYLFGIQDYHKATWGQNFVASIAGAVASITVAAPLDTVKTRIQNANFEQKVSGVTVVKDLIKNEGPTALFKGLTPKVSRSSLSCRSVGPVAVA